MNRPTKAIIERIGYYAKQLPIQNTEAGFEQHPISGEDLILCGHSQIEGKDIEKGKMYMIDVPVIHRVNHYERLLEAYKKNGKHGVFCYIKDYIRDENEESLRYEIYDSGNFEPRYSPEKIFERNKKKAGEEIALLEEQFERYMRVPEKKRSESEAEALNEQANKIIHFIAHTKSEDGVTTDMKYQMDDPLNRCYAIQRKVMKMQPNEI